jgi:hypothetical protein
MGEVLRAMELEMLDAVASVRSRQCGSGPLHVTVPEVDFSLGLQSWMLKYFTTINNF